MNIDWDRIESFIGFGNRVAPFVFVGMEEACDPAYLKADLLRRSEFSQVEDIEDAHWGIVNAARRFNEPISCQRTWRPMCDLMLRRRNHKPDKDARNQYQARELGRRSGETLLAELLPYPSPSARHWYYDYRYPTRKEYMHSVLPKRKQLLRDALAESNRELIVCYGKEHWPHYRTLFDEVAWVNKGQYALGSFMGTRIVLTPHFSSRAFNTDDQLQEFANLALKPS